MEDYSRTSWFLSVLIHILLFIVLLFISLPSITRQEFVDVFLGTPTAEAISKSNPPSAASLPPSASVPLREESQRSRTPVVLPERKIPDLSDEVFAAATSEKLDEREKIEKQVPQGVAQSNDDGRHQWQPVPSERKESIDKPFPATSTHPSIGGSTTSTSGRGVEYSLEWLGGGTRTKVSGTLPRYPSSASVSAQIRLQAVVDPNGRVRSVIPIQKAHPLFEQAAMNEVRSWMFEPLAANFPQVDQTCIITFYFLAR